MNTIKLYLHTIFLFSVFLMQQPASAMKRAHSALDPSSVEAAALAVHAASVVIEVALNIVLANQAPPPSFTNTNLHNRGVFLVTNEIGSEATVVELRDEVARGNVGIGVSAFFNLELFVARFAQGITHWVMIDPAPEVQAFWCELQAIFARTNNLDAVFEQLNEAMILNRGLFFSDGFLQTHAMMQDDVFENWLNHNLRLAQSRLHEQMRQMEFETLRRLVVEGLFFVPTDLAEPQSVTHLIDFLSQHDFLIDTIYASNVETYLPAQAIETFREQIKRLRSFTKNSGIAYLVDARPRGNSLFARTGKSYQKINFE